MDDGRPEADEALGGAARRDWLTQLRLDELLEELQSRMQTVLHIRDREHRLLEAVVAIGSDLDLDQVLSRIVEAAAALVDARYGALGVLGDDQRIVQFVTVGLTKEEAARIGPYPTGRGILGLLIREPRVLRLADLTQHPDAFGFPPGHPRMRTFLGTPIRVRGSVFGNLYLTEKRGGGEFDADDEAILSALASAAAVAIENARLYDDARRREQWLAATTEITRTLLSGAEPQDVLALVVERSRQLAAADLVAMVLPVPGGDGLRIELASGVGADAVRRLVVPAEASVSAEVLRTGEVVTVSDARDDPRVGAPLREAVELGPAVFVPLGEADHVRGVLMLGKRPGLLPFDPNTVAVISAFASQAAVALELAERRRDAEQLTVFQDRDRIARDLHDLVIQRLFASGMTLESVSQLIERPDLAERIRRVVDDLDETIKEIRSTIFALHHRGEAEERPGLRSRVLEVVEAARESLGFPPALRFEGLVDTDVPDTVGEHLLAVLREALSNAARHADADHVDVDISATGGRVRLAVTDDGVGIPPGGRRSGLAHAAARAEQLGGTLEVGPGEDGGTRLVWQVPLTDVAVTGN